MSAADNKLYRTIWDELAVIDPHVDLDDVDAEFLRRHVVDVAAASASACATARAAVDRERTKFRLSQLKLPTIADDDEYLVTGPAQRAKLAESGDDEMLAALALSDENLRIQFEANQARHAYYYLLAKYLHRGEKHNEAVASFYRDNPTMTP